MRNYSKRNNSRGEDLEVLAMLYAGGLLDARQSAEFEQLLAEEQRARDALSKATAKLLNAGPDTRRKPSQSYRKKVRERLRNSARPVVAVGATRRRMRGDPVLWVILGVTFSLILVVATTFWLSPGGGPTEPRVETPASRPGKLKMLSIEVPFEGESAEGVRVPNDPDVMHQNGENKVAPFSKLHRLTN